MQLKPLNSMKESNFLYQSRRACLAHRDCVKVYKLNALYLESGTLQAATYKVAHLSYHEGKLSLHPCDITTCSSSP